MADGKHCPGCLREVGIWSILSAGLPNRVRCPHCKARLRYRGTSSLLIGAVVLVIAVALGSLYAARQLAPDAPPLAQNGVFLLIYLPVVWCTIELPMVWLVRNYYELEVADPRPS